GADTTILGTRSIAPRGCTMTVSASLIGMTGATMRRVTAADLAAAIATGCGPAGLEDAAVPVAQTGDPVEQDPFKDLGDIEMREFEFIVVGSGAGSGPLAANLARQGHSVLLLEAGAETGGK